jgi:hypothetical protein
MNCSTGSDGYTKCTLEHPNVVFTPNKNYEILTSRPYLVARCNLPNHYAFVDTGFSGYVELVDAVSHVGGIWDTSELNDAYDRSLGKSRILWVGSGYMKQFGAVVVDYRAKTLSLSLPFLDEGEIGNTKPFGKFENPLFAMRVRLHSFSHEKTVDALGFVDTGNPSSFLLHESLTSELSPLMEPEICDCASSVDASIERKRITTALSDITMSAGGQKLVDRIRKVCSKTKGTCRSNSYNKTIRGSHVNPVVSLNLGNDALTSLSGYVLNYSEGTMYLLAHSTVTKSHSDLARARVVPVTPVTVTEQNETRDYKSVLKTAAFLFAFSFASITLISVYTRKSSGNLKGVSAFVSRAPRISTPFG